MPTLRQGPQSDQASNELSTMLIQWLTQYGANGLFKTCANCSHMTHDSPPRCTIYDVSPPASVIVEGCEKHEDVIEIPF